MNNILEFEGYSGTAEISFEDKCLHGKILFITDLVTYEAQTPEELKTEFIAAVKDYIQTCQEIGKEPEKSCKGSFNVRISPELHRKAIIESLKNDVSLNEIVSKAIDQYVNKVELPVKVEHHDHHHDHHHNHYELHGKNTSIFKDNFVDIGEDEWKISPNIISK